MLRTNKRTELVILFILLTIYLVLSTKDITLPGLDSDEAFNACSIINLIKNKDTYYQINLPLFGRGFPLMLNPYHGGLEAYLLVPFFFLFGINVFSLRIASISFGLLTLVFTYLLAKEFFNRQVAFITTLLLVASPYFIFATKIGNYSHSYSIFFSTTALFCFLKWHRGRNITYFLLGTFLLGLGSSAVGWFIVVVISFLILAIIFGKDIKTRIQRGRFKSIWLYLILGMISFCSGDFLVLYANFIYKPSRFVTLKWVFERFRNTEFGVDNLAYIKNLNSRLWNLVEILKESDVFSRTAGFLFKEGGNNLYAFMFFLILPCLIISLFVRKNMYLKKKKVAFLIALVCIMFAVSPFTVTCFSSWHLFILVPFIQLIVSVGLIEFAQFFKNRTLQKISLGIVFLILFLSIGLNLRILKDYYIDMRRMGGHGNWSDAIYELADWLKQTKASKIIATHWVLCRNLYFLMQGEKYIYDLTFYCNDNDNEEKYIKNYTELFGDENNIYLVNVQLPNNTSETVSQTLFKKAVDIAGKRLIEEKIFYQRNGKPVYIVYSVK